MLLIPNQENFVRYAPLALPYTDADLGFPFWAAQTLESDYLIRPIRRKTLRAVLLLACFGLQLLLPCLAQGVNDVKPDEPPNLPLRGPLGVPGVKPRDVQLTPDGVKTDDLPLHGIGPGTVKPRDVQLTPDGVRTQPTPPQPVTPEDIEAQKKLRQISDDSTKSSGALFRDNENIFVKPPLLTALITLQRNRSPYSLDADSENPVNLRDVLIASLGNNLNIKIAQTEQDIRKWLFYSKLGAFLPNLTNEVSMQAINGTYVSPAGLPIPIKNPFLNTTDTFQQYVYKGGSIIHGALKGRHDYRASQYHLKGTVNDILLEITRLYYDLVLKEVMLQVRIKGVETASALVTVQQDLYDNGVNTQLDVLQSKYRLSAERQKLIKEQVERRESAVKLAAALNADTGIDLTAKDGLVGKIRLVDSSLTANDLLKIAIINRPELKRYEHLRKAALEEVKVVRASLLPQVAAVGSVYNTGTNARSLSSLSGNNSNQGGTALASGGPGVGPVSGVSSLPLSGSSGSQNSKWTTRSLFLIGVDVQWNLGGMAVTEAAKVQAAKSEARRVQLEFNKELENIYKEVRDAYLSSISAENLIDETSSAVVFAKEGLRVAEVRLKDGVGTTLDVLECQRFYIDSLIDKAHAIIKFNTAQADILRAIGRVSVNTLTSNVPLKN